jgi:uncharacterized protein YoxC
MRGGQVSVTQIAALIAALAFLLLVGVLLVPILKLRRTVDAATRAVTDLADQTGPLLAEAHRTLDGVNTAVGQLHTTLDGVNAQLDRVDVMTGHAQKVTGDVARLSTIVTGVTASPLVKAAALGYGVRRGVSARRDAVAATPRRRPARARGVALMAGLLRRSARRRAAVAGGGGKS